MTKLTASVSFVTFVGFLAMSAASADAQSREVRLMAKMVTGAASGKADYRERGNRRRLNVEAEDLPANTPSQQAVFVNNVQVGIMPLSPCPAPDQHLLCGELELNTQDGEAVPIITRGQIVSIGMFPSLLSGTFRQVR
ncbi:MAG: hypothetical protein NNA23_12870 [Nitrospira sp.]|nr:hypothetical protein [Nitrospira sp.]